MGNPQRPVVAVVGGAKVSTKIELLANLVAKVDHLVIGGGMANTFLVAEGIEVGKSLAEREMAETAREIRHRAQKAGCQIHLPVDLGHDVETAVSHGSTSFSSGSLWQRRWC